MPRTNLGQKSRTGCRECKARRVKCDEQMPICGKCSKLKKRCSYLNTAPYLWRSGVSYQRSKSGSKSNSPRQPRHDAREGTSNHAKDNQGYSLDDMRLLHHFANYTSATLSDCPEVHKTWATTVVQIAFAHPFLLQGILALAALHMGSLNAGDKERLSILAASKQDAALKEFRAQIENITSENCDAIFAFSFLAEYYIPASAGTVINPAAMFMEHDFFDAIVDWLRLHQGTSEIYKSKGHWIRNCPVTPLLWSDLLGERCLSPTRKVNIKHTKTYQLYNLAKLWESNAVSTKGEFEENQINSRALEILDEAFNMLSEDPSPKENVGPATICELQVQLDKHQPLKENLTPKKTGSSNPLSLSFAWLFEIPSGFVGLLEQRRPAALIIFAHFAVLFQNAPKFWWNEPIPTKIVNAVAAVLPREYHNWIEWPIREVLSRPRQIRPDWSPKLPC